MLTATAVQAASLAPTHPALRWTPIDAAPALQHRRADSDRTACGTEGILTLAESCMPYCPDCFPRVAAAERVSLPVVSPARTVVLTGS